MLVPHMRPVTYRDGRGVHGPDAASNAFFRIMSGKVRFNSVSESGALLEVFELRPGAYFGDISILSDGPPPHHATAIGETRLLKMGAAAFRQLLAEQPALQSWMMSRLATQLRQAFLLFDTVRSSGPIDRVRYYLAWLASNGHGQAGADGQLCITISQSELASRLGLSRATVSAALATLKARGLIETGYRAITLIS